MFESGKARTYLSISPRVPRVSLMLTSLAVYTGATMLNRARKLAPRGPGALQPGTTFIQHLSTLWKLLSPTISSTSSSVKQCIVLLWVLGEVWAGPVPDRLLLIITSDAGWSWEPKRHQVLMWPPELTRLSVKVPNMLTNSRHLSVDTFAFASVISKIHSFPAWNWILYSSIKHKDFIS